MKKEIIKGLCMFALLFAFAALVDQPTKAQSLEYGLRANIPFEFTVADKKLPAGRYSIGRIRQNRDDLVIQISSLQEKLIASGFTIPVDSLTPNDKARLVFHRYGNQYFLFQVWAAGASTGRVFRQTRTERELRLKERGTLGMMGIREPQVISIVADLP